MARPENVAANRSWLEPDALAGYEESRARIREPWQVGASLNCPRIVCLRDGTLLIFGDFTRFYADGFPGCKGFSNDGGKTWTFQDLPFPITGRTCAGFLKDGRGMATFRSGVGRAALWAWIGDVNDLTGAQPMGGHFNDRHSVGLKDGALHIDSDGACGQFTKYNLRPADTEQSTLELTFEVQVAANAGRAASVSIPFAGVLRLFPDHVEMAHDTALRAETTSGRFHTYRVVSRVGRMELFIDGKPVWDTDKGDSRLQSLLWTKTSAYGFSGCFSIGLCARTHAEDRLSGSIKRIRVRVAVKKAV